MPTAKEADNHWFVPGFMLVASITLLVIGIPRFMHELMLVPGNSIYQDMGGGYNPSNDELALVEQSRIEALEFLELPSAYVELGATYLIRAQRAEAQGNHELKIDFANQSISFTQKGLIMAPLQPFAWTRMATAHAMLGEKNYQHALKAWRMSVSAAPFEPSLLFVRVHQGTILYKEMSDEDIAMLKEQLNLAFVWDPKNLRQYVLDHNLAEWVAFLNGQDGEMTQYLEKN